MFEFTLPDLGEGIHEGELVKWYVKEGDRISEDDPLCDIETDKAAVTIPSPRAGVVAKLNGEPGDMIVVNSVLLVIDESGTSKSSVEPRSSHEPQNMKESSSNSPGEKTLGNKAIAAPATRRVAREMKIDINLVNGSGPGGRVTREDLELYPGSRTGKSAPEPESIEPETAEGKQVQHKITGTIPFYEAPALPDFEALGPVDKEPIRSLRKKTAVKTTTSMIEVPHVAHMEEVDVTELEALRKKHNTSSDPETRLTLMAFIIRAAASLLRQHPAFNASVDPDKMQIIHKRFYHVGFAADTPRGLIVPVIKDADKKDVIQIAGDIKALAQKGRDGTITLTELSHGTFTITNVGVIGGTGVVPIINTPETAILGLGRVMKKPLVMENDDIVVRKVLPMTLSFDHRAADGAQAARFISRLKQMLEDPFAFMTGI